MKEISAAAAFDRITAEGPEFLIDADSLCYLIESEKPVTCFEGSDCIMLVSGESGAEQITVLPFCSTFDVGALTELLREYDDASIVINVQRLSDECERETERLLEKRYVLEKTTKDYMYSAGSLPAAVSPDIRMLDESDGELFCAMMQEPAAYRPPLHVLFDVFVARRQGHIAGAFYNGRIVGYLSFNEMLPNVFDVDYIYVVPEMRERGIGRELGSFYAAYAAENGHTAYWSSAKNTASENTALSCGFRLVHRDKKYVAAPRG